MVFHLNQRQIAPIKVESSLDFVESQYVDTLWWKKSLKSKDTQ